MPDDVYNGALVHAPAKTFLYNGKIHIHSCHHWRREDLVHCEGVTEQAGLIQTLVWPVISYGAEAWKLSIETRANIEAFEMWSYRRALRASLRRPRVERILDRYGKQN